MKKQIIRISPLQTAKVIAVLYFVFSIPFIALMAISIMLSPAPKPAIFSGFLLAMPFLYLIAGFLFTVTGAWIYNGIAKWLGGIEFSFADVETP